MRFSTRYSLGEEVFYYDVSLEKIIRSIVTGVKRRYYDGICYTAYDLKSVTGEEYCATDIDCHTMLDEVFSVSPDLIAKTEQELLERKASGLFKDTIAVEKDCDFGTAREYVRFSNEPDLDLYDKQDNEMLQLLGEECRISYDNGEQENKILKSITLTSSEIKFLFGLGINAIDVVVDHDFKSAKVTGAKRQITKIERC